MKRAIIIVLSVVGVVALLFAIVAGYAYKKISKDAWTKGNAWVYITQDDSVNDVLVALDATQGDTHGIWINLACKLNHLEKRLAPGAYYIKAGMSANQVVRKIALRLQDPVKLTFIGTRTLPELAGKISRCVCADSVQILNAMFDASFLAECGCDSANVGSVFLPDTYEIYWTIAPDKLMQKMLTEYRKYWNEERKTLAEKLHLTPWQVSTICSIAEEETANRQERGVVARLYWNRYEIGMPLQADPTVKYATGDFALRRILTKHLSVKSPYNTYMNRGLPPGPIRVVEKATIDAFLHSQPHKYLYMCAKEDFSGLHNFASTLAAHNLNAARYHRALSQNGIR